MKKYVPFVIGGALFMETIDATILSTAIPTMSKSLGASPISLKIAVTSYLLSLAIFIPISGWFADRYGTKKVFIHALFIFGFGSLLCGLAVNLQTLVAARIIQGFGGALMMPVGRLILLKTFQRGELVKVTNYMTMPSQIGAALGPVLGGIIVCYTSWRWIFIVNVPLSLIGIVFTLKIISNYINKGIKKLDVIGFILFGIGLAGIAFVFEALSENLQNTYLIIVIGMLSAISLFVYCIRYQTTQSYFLDFSIFKVRTFSLVITGSFLSRCGIGGMPFIFSLFFQLSLGKTAMTTGFLLLPYAIGMFLIKFFVGYLLKHVGFKNLLVANTLLLGLSILEFTLVSENTPLVLTVALIFVHGILTSMQFSCMNVLIYVDLSADKISTGTSIVSTVQQLSMSFGITIAVLILRSLVGDTNDFFNLKISSFHETFFLLGLFTMLTSVVFVFLRRNDGIEASKHKSLKSH